MRSAARVRRAGKHRAAVLWRLTFIASILSTGGCYHTAQNVSDSLDLGLITRKTDSSGAASYALPSTPIVPKASLRLTPNFSLSLENMLIGAAIYYFVDPLAPNWEGEMRRVSDDTFSIAMRAKRFRSTGGDGEAGRVFRRNAEQITREGGFARYDVLSYSEGIESETLGAVRFAEGLIRISRK
ncbi:MAG: hypothetical protein R3E40_03070 [Rhodocyclaceae bacterium]|nr:hypothetical protein [Rhodocyclaceae bacterium]MCW5596431.1 hypothetical protein [Rhodocyclaceae bacterium]